MKTGMHDGRGVRSDGGRGGDVDAALARHARAAGPHAIRRPRLYLGTVCGDI